MQRGASALPPCTGLETSLRNLGLGGGSKVPCPVPTWPWDSLPPPPVVHPLCGDPAGSTCRGMLSGLPPADLNKASWEPRL